jgi:DNA-binding beta-propeller fold protein YncE
LGDEGPATDAQLNGPRDVALTPDGGFYIADRSNHRLRYVDPTGTIDTVAGTGTAQSTGDGGLASAASLNHPLSAAVGPDGSVYVAELQGGRIRRIDPLGTIDTVAGGGGSLGAGGPATAAKLFNPSDVVVGPDGSRCQLPRPADGLYLQRRPPAGTDHPPGWGHGGLRA